MGALGRRPALQGRPRLRSDREVPRRRRVDDRAGGEGAAPHRGRAQAADRREHAPAAGTARAVRLLEPARHERGRCGRCASRWRRWRGPTTTVLIRGESGTGKELDRPRHPLQLAAGEEAVRQGELRRAAREPDRVGAVRLREGRVHRRASAQEGPLRAAPRAGTLFLDEIGEIDPATQVKLLRVLQEREFERLGGDRDAQGQRPADRGDEQGPREGDRRRARFREDLYYRLNVFPIFVPPLRERKSDIPAARRPFPREATPRRTARTSGASRRRPSTC